MKSVLLVVFTLMVNTGLFYVGSTYAAEPVNDKPLPHLSVEDELPEYSKVYDDQRNPFNDANAALALAKKTNRNVLIEIGGNWCTWCHKMDAFLLKNPNVYQALHNKYVLLKISVSDSNENDDFMKSLPPVLGYPHMYISTASGKMLLSKDTAELQDSDGYSTEYWLDFLQQWQLKQQNL
ncbi:thioredoxin family protein [Candidatus Colwellia aromaticivorans]|uniref:thioredoxin family protein n=1 Tax=Candidatus Colwellia aromaticivorans TaxID=2267621 RepID=UPI001FE9B74B|nr:thioredoxin family protein [Candidatus Colwellia aromaticivorans]